MKKDVIISITGINLQNDELQENQAPSGDVIEFITTGNLYDKNGKFYIMYRESEMTGFGEETTTTLKVDGDVITLMRNGPNSSQMVFEKGKKDISLYNVGFGALTIGVKARRLKNELGPNGGHLEISYGIEIGEEVKGLNSFIIDVRQQETALPQ